MCEAGPGYRFAHPGYKLSLHHHILPLDAYKAETSPVSVVTPLHDPEYVITAYFDRTKPCA